MAADQWCLLPRCNLSCEVPLSEGSPATYLMSTQTCYALRKQSWTSILVRPCGWLPRRRARCTGRLGTMGSTGAQPEWCCWDMAPMSCAQAMAATALPSVTRCRVLITVVIVTQLLRTMHIHAMPHALNGWLWQTLSLAKPFTGSTGFGETSVSPKAEPDAHR